MCIFFLHTSCDTHKCCGRSYILSYLSNKMLCCCNFYSTLLLSSSEFRFENTLGSSVWFCIISKTQIQCSFDVKLLYFLISVLPIKVLKLSLINVLDLTELSIEGDNKTNLEVLVKKVGYSNSREFPTPGRRNLHLSTVVMWVWNLISSFRVHLLNDGCLKRTEQYNFQISPTITLWSTIYSYVVCDTWFKLNLCQCELVNVCTVFCWIYNYYALDFLAVAMFKSEAKFKGLLCFKLSNYSYLMLSVMTYLSHLSEL